MAPPLSVTLPSQEELRALFRYDAKTGQLFWKKRPREMFNSGHQYRAWNTRFADKEAFTHINHMHRRGMLFRHSFYAHRVIWKMMTGNDVAETDHIDGNPLNNAWRNLRDGGAGTNQKNSKKRSDNTSGQVGVVRRGNRWIAQIGVFGTTRHVGIYDSLEKAIEARKSAELEYGFHPNHGRNV